MDAATTAKLPAHHLHRQSQSLFHLIYSGCEAKDSQKSKLNHCTSQEPKWRANKEGTFGFRYRRKTTENLLSGKPIQPGRD